MLGQVVAHRQKTGGRRKLVSMVPASPATPSREPPAAKIPAPGTPKAAPRIPRTKKPVQDVTNQKITDFFPVRKSSRKTGKQIELEAQESLCDAIYNGSNEKQLEVFTDKVKGRGVRAGRSFLKNDFVIEYRGVMLDYAAAKEIEEEYSKDDSVGSYMYFFVYKNKKWCVDATKETDYKGRLLNHSYLQPNLRTKVVAFNGFHHLILVAKRDIDEGEELLFDYGDRSAEAIAKNPWLMTT